MKKLLLNIFGIIPSGIFIILLILKFIFDNIPWFWVFFPLTINLITVIIIFIGILLLIIAKLW